MVDSSSISLRPDFLFAGQEARDRTALAGRLAEQFRIVNEPVLQSVGVEVRTGYDGSDVCLEVKCGTTVGAVPLRSPTSGQPELGLVIRPRYEWAGLGVMLGEMGWKVLPSPLPLPNLPRSERKVPPWVLSAIVLGRLEALLTRLQRRFDMTRSIRTAPYGQVDWQAYAVRHIGVGQFAEVPCCHPELELDRHLRGAIHFALRQHHASLDSQRHAGPFVAGLLQWAEQLLQQVRAITPRIPTDIQLRAWRHGRLRSDVLHDGLDAIVWTIDERGLAGLCDLHGLPWSMSMETFFEAWVERLLEVVTRHLGGIMRTGRQRQTVIPIDWDPPFTGSQRFLLPDLVIETPTGLIVVDAKYKDHWEELAVHRWGDLEETVRDRHRIDLLQVIAYGSPFDAQRLTLCLLYPCRLTTWQSLRARGRVVHCGSLGLGSRSLQLVLAAVPMDGQLTDVVEMLVETLRPLGTH
ncbi:hypothetical protein AYO40_05555 [Planctomycetaceae bacterium SCGC AG-212-D15]|nr:hypothetical protein AYO40_05555 [Planctomycetaceae bacterium SCGC AG-212-D15]